MVNSEVTKVVNKLDISDGSGLGVALGFVERIKLGGDERSGQVLSGGNIERDLFLEFMWVKV